MLRKLALAMVIAFVVSPAKQDEVPAPLPPRVVREPRPYSETWTRKSARLDAIVVHLGAVGAHTHANWVFFRLPFDTTELDRIRAVVFTPSADSDPDVSAVRIGSVCLSWAPYGPLDSWAEYTVSGIGRSIPFSDHSRPPTDDPTLLGINVPTRVANYVACGRGDGRLREPSFWHLDVAWEER
jgi:hypothetical protein